MGQGQNVSGSRQAVFARNALEKLRQWSIREGRKPLVIRGARQVGKTTLVKELGRSFEAFLLLDLDKDRDRRYFTQGLSIKEIFDDILITHGFATRPASVLLFLDEIQSCPEAVTSLRYFYEEMPEVHVIAAGSLLERLFMEGRSFPVGRVEYLTLHPCAFDEFLEASGYAAYALSLRQGRVSAALHQPLLRLFSHYILVGGMPEAVNAYARSRLLPSDEIYKNLQASYIDDIDKYAKTKAQSQVLVSILQQGWGYAGERLSFSAYGGGNFQGRSVAEAFRLLEQVYLLELVYPTVTVEPPPRQNFRKRPKLLWMDTGLVCHLSGTPLNADSLLWETSLNSSFRGSIIEHVIGQELLSHETEPLTCRYFWVREAKNSSAEIDYLYFSKRHGMIPIEIKSGTNSRLTSLHIFMRESSARVAVRFWPKPVQVDEVQIQDSEKRFTLISVPFYCAGHLDALLDHVLKSATAE